MQYLGYLLILVVFLVGFQPYQAWHPALVIGCAVVSTLLYMAARRREVTDKNYTGGRNMIADGAYLITVQMLIMFTAYILAYFFANKVSTGG